MSNTLSVEKINNKWSVEAKQHVAVLLLTSGNLREVAKITGVPYETIVDWRKSDDWDSVIIAAKRQRNEQLQRGLYTLTDLAMEKTKDRLENGEWILNNKTGEMVRKPPSLRDTSRVLEASINQVVKLDHGVSAIQNQSTNEILKDLAAQFAKFASKKKPIDVVDVEFKEV
jgi:hypothetical protein